MLENPSMPQAGGQVEFRSDIEEVLKAAGWHRDRKVDAREWLEGLERDGLAAVPVAVTILENFGGLVVRSLGNPPGEFTIDPDVRDVLGIRDAEEFLGVELTPLGVAGCQYHLLASRDGRVFEKFGEHLRLLGDGFEEALETICSITRMSVQRGNGASGRESGDERYRAEAQGWRPNGLWTRVLGLGSRIPAEQ